MQKIFILLTLFIFSAPVLSEASDDLDKHPEQYRTYPNDFDAYHTQSENSDREYPHYLKLLITINKDQKIVTVKT